MSKAFLVLVFFFVVSTGFTQNTGYYKFIENKGQWPKQVGYKCELENGNLFLEDNGFTYNFWDNSEVTNLHANPKAKEILKTHPPIIRGHVYKVEFLNNTFKKKYLGSKKSKEYHNYFQGNDPKKWAGKCALYEEIRYSELYPGIDLKMYSSDFFLKYDFIIAPKADPSEIQIKYAGMDDLQLQNGRLEIKLSVNTIVEQKPLAWQIIKGHKKFIACNYVLRDSILSLDFPKGYNSNYELIIDPELIFATYSGSTSDNFGYTATYDNDGFLYSGSSVFGLYGVYPTTVGAYQITHAGGVGSVWFLGGTDIAITKYDTTGTFRVYSTYLGGNGDELPHSLIVNDQDELYVYGTTSSDNFPTLSNSYDSSFGGGIAFQPNGVGVNYQSGSDIIVTKFNADGSDLAGSTYLGGSSNDGINNADSLAFNYADEMRGEILLDSNNEVYIVSSTFSNDFPIVNGFQNTIGGAQDGCIVKMDAALSTIIWSSFLGGSNNDAAYAITLDTNDDIYVTGGTQSTNFPIPNSGYQNINAGGRSDGYIVKINQNGQAILAGTYYGSSEYDQLYFVETDLDNHVYVYGQTLAPNNFFIDNANYGQPNSGMLVAKFDETLETRIWSTVFGTGVGKCNLSPTAFLVDVCNRIYLSGWGGATNITSAGGSLVTTVSGMDISTDAYQSTTDGSDFYLLVIDDDANDMIYSTFFGGGLSHEHVDGGTSRFSPDGTIYQSVCAGCGGYSDFPTYPDNAVSPTNNSFAIANGDSLFLCNNAVFKMEFGFPTVSSVFEVPSQYCINEDIPLVNNSEPGAIYTWDFGDGSPTSNEQFPIHTFADTGTYLIQLTAYNATCDVTVNSSQEITIITSSTTTTDELNLCYGQSEIIGPDTIYSNYNYLWSPDAYLSDNTLGNPEANPPNDQNYSLLIYHDGCVDTLNQEIIVHHPAITLPEDTILCAPSLLSLEAISAPLSNVQWSDEIDFENILGTSPSLEIQIDTSLTLFGLSEIMGCTATDSMNIWIIGQTLMITPDFTSCANDTISLEIINPQNQLDYHWAPENLILAGQNTAQVNTVLTENTTYYAQATYSNLCTATDSVIVSVSNVTAAEIFATATPQTILSGEEVQLNGFPNGYYYSWSPGESLDNPSTQNPLASPEESTTYQLTIIDGDCIYKTAVLVKVYDFICGNPTIYVPNAFTPNQNDQNEKIWVRGNNLTSIYFVIYDRWGEKIFETTDQTVGWDGTYQGEMLDPAVFVYYLEAVCSDGQQYFEKGNITLIR